jgi:hypothetical protein
MSTSVIPHQSEMVGAPKQSILAITDTINQLFEMLESPDTPEEDKPAISAELDRVVQTELAVKTDSIAYADKYCEKAVEALKQGKRETDADYTRRINQWEARQQRIRDLCKYALLVVGEKKFKGDVKTISLQDGRKTLHISDESLIPVEYMCWQYRPVRSEARSIRLAVDESKVKAAINKKVDVPGAEYKIGDSFIQIR